MPILLKPFVLSCFVNGPDAHLWLLNSLAQFSTTMMVPDKASTSSTSCAITHCRPSDQPGLTF
ncbi:MAG: hypothetical protein JRI82_15445 [Deltaproteobacteria bacterium]|nr:hypothetical protein [Deltaproteobacteria bacterium]